MNYMVSWEKISRSFPNDHCWTLSFTVQHQIAGFLSCIFQWRGNGKSKSFNHHQYGDSSFLTQEILCWTFVSPAIWFSHTHYGQIPINHSCLPFGQVTQCSSPRDSGSWATTSFTLYDRVLPFFDDDREGFMSDLGTNWKKEEGYCNSSWVDAK